MIPVDTRYWEMKWEETCGYLIFKDKFSSMDVNNARYRYDRRRDENFPIAFDKKTYTIINNRLKGNLDKKNFWAAVVAPTQAFFDNDWREYYPKGEEFRQFQLAALISNRDRVGHLSEDKQDYALMVAGKELMDMGMTSTYNRSAAYYIPKPMKRDFSYTTKENYSDDDVMDSLDDIYGGIE